VRYVGPAYRGHNPKWAFAPTSGEGAAIHGGRFNPKGVPALYLATTVTVALLEATQGFAYKFNPLTLCAYDVDCADAVDLTTAAGREEARVSEADMACAWFGDIAEGRRPASWKIHDALAPAAAGILVPSFAYRAPEGSTNLVLWDWGDTGPRMVRVHDPDQRLPRNAASWG
jgi:RES domain-containing protein